MTGAYIIEAFSAVRERHALRQIMRTDVLREPILREMGLTDFSWVILDFDVQWTKRKPGDIDIIGGRLRWHGPDSTERAFSNLSQKYPHWNESFLRQFAAQQAAESGKIHWPPDLAFIAGVEAKCAFFRDGTPYSAKPYAEDVASLRDQVNGLLLLDLDRVALLDVIATEPTGGVDIAAWIGAREMSGAALDAMRPVLADRLPDYSPAGHIALSVGAVAGGDESFRGAPVHETLRTAESAPVMRDQIRDRVRLTKKLQKTLAAQPIPRIFPAVFVQCVPCGRIHSIHDASCKFSITAPQPGIEKIA